MKLLLSTLATLLTLTTQEFTDEMKKPPVYDHKEMELSSYLAYNRNMLRGLEDEIRSFEFYGNIRSLQRFQKTHLYMMSVYIDSIAQHRKKDKDWATAISRFKAHLLKTKLDSGEKNGRNVRRLNEEITALKAEFKDHSHRLREYQFVKSMDETKVIESA
jgi:hypothetical protein